MCYYTVTMDHSNSDGHTRAIMIIDAKDDTEAHLEFLRIFGFKFYKDLLVSEGIHIPAGFDRLLTEHVKKYILKAKNKSPDAPMLSYQNMIHLKHGDYNE